MEHVIGDEIKGKRGWFAPGPDDSGLADGSTHTPTDMPEGQFFVKQGGNWRLTTVAEVEAAGGSQNLK